MNYIKVRAIKEWDIIWIFRWLVISLHDVEGVDVSLLEYVMNRPVNAYKLFDMKITYDDDVCEYLNKL